MSRRIFCKFFGNGACLKGEHCEFSHDWNDSPGPYRETVFNNVCTFYQKGVCSYGSRCRYAHIKIESAPSLLSSNSVSPTTSDSVQDASLSGVRSNGERRSALSSATELTDSSKAFLPPSTAAGTQSNDTRSHLDYIGSHPIPISLAERPICSFAVDDGNCPYGENCPKIHGDVCFRCGKHCLHPYRPVEREEHIKFCEKKYNKWLEILKQSEEIECSVCLDRVLSKATPSERRFGLLSECDHPFCISCIRNWRSNSASSGMDVNTVLRACPVCRKRSYFVIPSDIWYSTKEEKQKIINSYKAKLRSIDCKYFDFGHGKCPFGTSCFYKHTYSALGRNLPRTYYPVQDTDSALGRNLPRADYLIQDFTEEEEEFDNLIQDFTEEEEEFDNLMFEHFAGEALALEQTGDELEDSDDELEIAYMIMQMDLGGSESSTDADIKFP